ncbi:SprT-like domain-containing protein [Planctomycetota bacterium]|nr:SprT-like domain-containing protein [Planctomycetota bacterium]
MSEETTQRTLFDAAPEEGSASPESRPEHGCPEVGPDRWRARLDHDREAMDRAQLTERMLGRCVRRLGASWSDLNYRYLKNGLQPPSIKLHQAEQRWGTWHPDRRLITVARRQVLCYTWESVVETLKHEMAHQVVSELFGCDHEPAHGPAFQRACDLLACDPAPRGDGGVPLLDAGGLGAQPDPDDARLRKVQKLLALADNNPNEHEAKAAFARASELMLKYNLDAEQAVTRDYVARHLGKSSGRVPHHRYVIAGLLQEFFFVQCIWVDSYVVATGVAGHVLEVAGRRANVEMAEYVHECLERQCEALWRQFKLAHQVRDRGAKREYIDGLLAGFRKQLKQSSTRSAEHGLVWVGDPGLNSYMRARHPKTTRTRLGAVGLSDVRSRGVEAGQRMRLHQPLSARGGQATSRGRLLPG